MKVRIREILDEKDKSVYWLANETGIHYTNLNKIVKNITKSIKYENIEKLCKTLNCTPNDIFVFEYIES